MPYERFKSLGLSALLGGLAFTYAPIAHADNIANCEIVLMETIEDETGAGSAAVASYRPAGDFIASIYAQEGEVLRKIDGLTIRGLLCQRANVVISDSDFPLLASGVPFILSQNFDSSNSDLITYYFKDGKFRVSHKGADLTPPVIDELKTRMADFNGRNHELIEREIHALEEKELEDKELEEKAAGRNANSVKGVDDGGKPERQPIKIVTLEPEQPNSDMSDDNLPDGDLPDGDLPDGDLPNNDLLDDVPNDEVSKTAEPDTGDKTSGEGDTQTRIGHDDATDDIADKGVDVKIPTGANMDADTDSVDDKNQPAASDADQPSDGN